MNHHFTESGGLNLALIHLSAGWIGILLGMIAGACIGLKFTDDHWLTGYNSWARRMNRLGHVSFFGIGFLNIAVAICLPLLEQPVHSHWITPLYILGAIAMPSVCFLSAWRKPLHNLFPIPVLALVGGTVLYLMDLF